MPRIRRTARIISVAKDTSASATHDASSEEAEFNENDELNLADVARGKQARPPPPPGTAIGKHTRTPPNDDASSESEESSEEAESQGDMDQKQYSGDVDLSQLKSTLRQLRF